MQGKRPDCDGSTFISGLVHCRLSQHSLLGDCGTVEGGLYVDEVGPWASIFEGSLALAPSWLPFSLLSGCY